MTKILFNLLCCVFLLFVSFSCNDDESLDEPPVVENTDPQYLELDSDYIFDQDKLLTFDLILSEENLAFINDDPAAEEYVEGELKFEGETISPVGIRYKGSIGAFVGCLSGDNWANPSGYKTCPKLSMRIKINWDNSSDKFYGLKKLQFHSMNQDASQMKERLGYHLFRSMGVAAPRCVHARVLINGKFSGVYTLVEQVDGRFADYHFDDGSGNIYKEVWPLSGSGEPRSDASYIEALKTNEEEANIDIIKEFAQELSASDETNVKQVVGKYMDVDKALSYCLVDRMIKHDDGPFHWYCGGGDCNPHNFFLYENPSENKVHIIPWDLDHTFSNYTNPNLVLLVPDAWGETRNNCEPFDQGGPGIQQRSAACDKLINGLVQYDTEYDQLKQEFKQGPFSQGEVEALIAKWKDQIANVTEEAVEVHDWEAISIAKWHNSMDNLKEALTLARNN